MDEIRWSAQAGQVPVAPNCPRCASANTKFCYYNNYSLTQPRYFCKGCRRYWTKGGSLRNVPVGGGCRRTRRSRSRAHASHRNSSDNNSPTDTDSSSSSTATGAEIDMAAVFARYVGQDSGVRAPATGLEIEKLDTGDAPFNQEMEGMGDLSSYDYKMLFTDDVFWSTSENNSSLSSSNATAWEPMAALEELESSPLEFTLASADPLLGDDIANWGCFDLPGYADFSSHLDT